MRFVPGQRRIEISAGEFAAFGEPVGAYSGGGFWRAEVGRDWHATLREREIERRAGNVAGDDAVEFEVGVRFFRIQNNWTFEITGRIDRLRKSGNAVEVCEIKTVSEKLPQPEAYWRETRRAFFSQLAVYCAALAQAEENAGKTISGKLVLVEPASGVIQEIPLRESPEFWLAPTDKLLANFGESRLRSRVRLGHLKIHEPYSANIAGENFRHEWEQSRAELRAVHEPVVFLEAPTGYGKTALALDCALRRLRDGEVSRIVYVTGKNSGRIQVLRELERLTEPGALRVFTLHSRDAHFVAGIPDDPEIWQQNWRIHNLDTERIFNEGKTSLEEIKRLGASAGVPPWEITRALLPLAEFVLCDYNYVFSPRHAGFFEALPGRDSGEEMLVVDEAHNLPARAAGARSVEVSAGEAREALFALANAGASRDWLRHQEAWADFLDELPAGKELSESDAYLLRDLCAEIERLFAENPPFYLELSEPVLEVLFAPIYLARALEHESVEFLFWSPRKSVFVAECLCAAGEIGETVRGFGRALLMSATLAPAGDFLESCDLANAKFRWFECDAGWREGAYDVAVDRRVDTRMKSREQYFRLTAETVLEIAGDAVPAVVFFPSYRYAEAVREYVKALDSGFFVAVQPAGAQPAENAAFIEEALFSAHAIFLVLGGGLAEGIDLLGGRVSRAMVVSPALPEVNAAQAARIALFERRGADDAFRRVYLVPAMRKVNQALGRLVRAPGQRAKVLLHCRRFCEKEFSGLLAPEYRGGRVIARDTDLADWLK